MQNKNHTWYYYHWYTVTNLHHKRFILTILGRFALLYLPSIDSMDISTNAQQTHITMIVMNVKNIDLRLKIMNLISFVAICFLLRPFRYHIIAATMSLKWLWERKHYHWSQFYWRKHRLRINSLRRNVVQFLNYTETMPAVCFCYVCCCVQISRVACMVNNQTFYFVHPALICFNQRIF